MSEDYYSTREVIVTVILACLVSGMLYRCEMKKKERVEEAKVAAVTGIAARMHNNYMAMLAAFPEVTTDVWIADNEYPTYAPGTVTVESGLKNSGPIVVADDDYASRAVPRKLIIEPVMRSSGPFAVIDQCPFGHGMSIQVSLPGCYDRVIVVKDGKEYEIYLEDLIKLIERDRP